MTLSQDPRDAAAVLRSLIRGVSGSVLTAAGIGRRRAHSVRPSEQGPVDDSHPVEPLSLPARRSPSENPVRRLSVDDAELASLVRDLVSNGTRVWITASGGSMSPAIPPGSRVRLAPLPVRSLAPGEVVLAMLGGDRCVLHRVVWERDGYVRLQGDSNLTPDPVTPRTSVIAIADLVDTATGPAALSNRGTRPLWRLIRARLGSWRSAVASMIRR